MKLRNKKTGEIVEVESLYLTQAQELYLNYINKENKQKVYMTDKIASFTLEWEDYEEKTAWFIDPQGDIQEWRDADCDDWTNEKEIGNYFETKEEAELAVRKLKAWKRLKDKGFRFLEGYLDNNDDFIIKAKLDHVGLIDQSEVSLLFGGEE